MVLPALGVTSAVCVCDPYMTQSLRAPHAHDVSIRISVIPLLFAEC